MSWTLKAQGYGGDIAFHPGMRTSYNRNNVYPLLGFDRHIALEDLNHPKMLRAYVSDQQDFEKIEQEYEVYKKSGRSNPFYLFNVTIQNHAGYKLSNGTVGSEIAITDDNVREEEAEQYLNLIKKTDDAMQQLIQYFQKVSEPTVIVFFGDHQPRVGSDFYNALYGKTSSALTKEETNRKYQVPFMIWANYPIQEKQKVEISANYLSSYLLQQTGGKMTGYNKYLMSLHQKIPVLTDIAYRDTEGNTYNVDDPDSQYADLVRQYQQIQYNGFDDRKHQQKQFFYLKK